MSPGARLYTVNDIVRVSEVSQRRAQTAWNLLELGAAAELTQAVAAVVVAYLVLDGQLRPQDKAVARRIDAVLSNGWESGEELYFAGGHCELHFRSAETGLIATEGTVFVYEPAEIAERLISET